MNIVFYSFSKRKNSTKVPTSGGTTYDCQIKSPCSMLKPVIELALTTTPNWNYCYIQAWNRYYWITDKTFDSGIWYITCKVDPLASGKSDILGSSALVLYSSSNYNLDILDRRLCGKGSFTRAKSEQIMSGVVSQSTSGPGGMFGLRVVNDAADIATGASVTYYLSIAQMRVLTAEIYSQNVWDQLVQYFTNPLDAIIECWYIPFTFTGYITGGTYSNVKIGTYTSRASGMTIANTDLALSYQTAQLTLPNNYGDFRDMEPYSSYTMFFPYCGSKSLDSTLIYKDTIINVDYSVDFNSGDIQAIVYNSQNMVVTDFSGNCKISLPMGHMESRLKQIGGVVSGATQIAAGAASEGPLAALAIVGGVANVVGSIAAPKNYNTMGGMSGSILGCALGNDSLRWQYIRIVKQMQDLTDTPANMRARMGNALNAVVSLSTLTGYVQTLGASVAGSWTDAELTEINAALDSGIYIE